MNATAGDKPRSSNPHRAEPALEPLAGEAGIPSVAQETHGAVTARKVAAFGGLLLTLAAASAWSYQHFAGPSAKPAKDQKRSADQPAAATLEPRKLELPQQGSAPVVTAATASAPPPGPTTTQATTLQTRTEPADPLGLDRQAALGAHPQGQMPMGGPVAAAYRSPNPEDAPVLLVASRGALPGIGAASTRPSEGSPTPGSVLPASTADPLSATTRNLEGYQRQLQGLLDTLTRTTALAAGNASEGAPQVPHAPMPGPMVPTAMPMGLPAVGHTPTTSAPGAGLFGGQLPASNTPRVTAAMLGNRSLTLAKGTAFTCALKTRVVSAVSGLVGCQVQRHVYSDDGRVLLIERGSHLDGEYRIANVRQGMVRVPVLWTRIRTPHGVTVDLDSPATGALGESGIDGEVDNRWPERIGAAMLLSLIDDSVKLVIQSQTQDHGGDTIFLPSTTSNVSKLAEKVLDSTINIPPLITQNQGGIVGIYVARDVDFSSVYELRPAAIGAR